MLIILFSSCDTKQVNEKLENSEYSIDSLKSVYPEYKKTVLEDSSLFFLSNYIDTSLFEVLAFDSNKVFRQYQFYSLISGDISYELKFDDKMNLIRSSGLPATFFLEGCVEKEDGVVFHMYPISPPLFETKLYILSRVSNEFNTTYDSIAKYVVKDDKPITLLNSTFIDSTEYKIVFELELNNTLFKDSISMIRYNCGMRFTQ